MKNKILGLSLGILCALLILETGYLMGVGEKRRICRAFANQYRPSHPARNIYAAWDAPRTREVKQETQPIQEVKKSFFVASMTSKDTEAANIITINLTGFDKENIKLEVKGRYLTVQAKQKQETSVNRKDFYGESVSAANFVQSVMLPENVKVEQIRAEFNKDTLTITIPKDKKAKATQENVANIPIR